MSLRGGKRADVQSVERQGGGKSSATGSGPEEDSYDSRESEDDYDEEEDEKEPILKYKRLTGAFQKITSTEDITAMAVHEQFLVVGTAEGNLHRVRRLQNGIASGKVHSMRVTGISVDASGDTIATCSDDGTVHIMSISTKEHSHFKFHTPLRAVCLAPAYSRMREKVFACGGLDGKLVLNHRGWLSSRDEVLHAGEGPIQAIAWSGSLLAWASDAGVKVYDVSSKSRVTFLPIPEGCPGLDVCRCHLVWENEKSLLIGWADTIQTLSIRTRDPTVAAAAGLPVTFAELVSVVQTTFIVCGLYPYDDELLVALGYVMAAVDEEEVEAYVDALRRAPPPDGAAASLPADAPPRPPIAEVPEVHMLDRRSGEEVVTEALPVRGYAHHHALDYRLCALSESGGDRDQDGAASACRRFAEAYIVSPRDVVVSRPRSAVDSAKWALARGALEDALGLLEKAEAEAAATSAGAAATARDGETTAGAAASAVAESLLALRAELASRRLGELIAAGQKKRAAASFEELVGPIPGPVDTWVQPFIDAGCASALLPFFPHADRARASTALGTSVLCAVAREDPAALLHALHDWGPLPAPAPANDAPAVQRSGGGGGGDGGGGETGSGPGGAFDPEAVEHAVAEQARVVGDRASLLALREARARLLRACGRPEEAFEALLQCVSTTPGAGAAAPGVAEALAEAVRAPATRHKAAEHVAALMRASPAGVADALAEDTEAFPIREVVRQLDEVGDDSLLHAYLDRLSREPGATGYNAPAFADLHDRQLALYAALAPRQLASFLSRSAVFSEREALRICEQHPDLLVEERVRLHEKFGAAGEASALRILVHDVGSARRAVRFVAERPREGLWDRLFEFALEKPEFLGKLITRVTGTPVRPWDVIERIPRGMPIPKLRQRLLKLFDANRQRLLLQQSSMSVLRSDALVEAGRLVSLRKRGVLVPYSPFFSVLLHRAMVERRSSSDGVAIHVRMKTGEVEEVLSEMETAR